MVSRLTKSSTHLYFIDTIKEKNVSCAVLIKRCSIGFACVTARVLLLVTSLYFWWQFSSILHRLLLIISVIIHLPMFYAWLAISFSKFVFQSNMLFLYRQVIVLLYSKATLYSVAVSGQTGDCLYCE